MTISATLFNIIVIRMHVVTNNEVILTLEFTIRRILCFFRVFIRFFLYMSYLGAPRRRCNLPDRSLYRINVLFV